MSDPEGAGLGRRSRGVKTTSRRQELAGCRSEGPRDIVSYASLLSLIVLHVRAQWRAGLLDPVSAMAALDEAIERDFNGGDQR